MPRRRHDTLYLPAPIRSISQPLLCFLLTKLAGYSVELEGDLPDQAVFLAGYPHRQHADSVVLHLVLHHLSVMGAADHWFHTNQLKQLGVSALVNTIPLIRENKMESSVGRTDRDHEHDMVGQALSRGDNVLFYVQGSRVGPADSLAEFYSPGVKPELRGMKPGIALHAQKHQRPVVPLGIIYPPDYQPSKLNDVPDAWNNFKARLRGGGRRVKLVARLGQPLDPPQQHDRAPDRKRAREDFLATLAPALFNLAHSEQTTFISLPVHDSGILMNRHARQSPFSSG